MRSRRWACATSTCRPRASGSGARSRTRGRRGELTSFRRGGNSLMAMLDDAALDIILKKARTQNGWLDAPVTEDQLRAIYDLMRVGPTSANTCPARIVFLRTQEAKARLLPALSPGNVDKTKAAPVTAIIGYDTQFFELLPKLFPHRPEMKDN